MIVIILVFLGAIGLAFGSFVGAFTWRLHERKNFVSDRSECERCHHKLGALDLIPLFSWLALRGKCRYCHAPIGYSAPLLEVTMAVLFVGSYLVWPLVFDTWQAYVSFGLWLVYLVGLMALMVYDLRWMLLPNAIIFPLIGVAIADSIIRYSLTGEGTANYLLTTVYGVLVLGGLYWAMYTFSKGKWVGYGDVKLGVFMGIALGFQRSLLALFLANIVGFVVLMPGLMVGRLTRHSRVPFGPFMIIAFILAFLFGDSIIDWYLRFIFVK